MTAREAFLRDLREENGVDYTRTDRCWNSKKFWYEVNHRSYDEIVDDLYFDDSSYFEDKDEEDYTFVA